jgi:hypothetical protein
MVVDAHTTALASAATTMRQRRDERERIARKTRLPGDGMIGPTGWDGE